MDYQRLIYTTYQETFVILQYVSATDTEDTGLFLRRVDKVMWLPQSNMQNKMKEKKT